MAMMPWVKQQPMNGSNILKMEYEPWLTINFKTRTSDCPGEKYYPLKSSTDCPKSCRRDWNIHWFTTHYAKTLHWWSQTALIFHLRKSRKSSTNVITSDKCGFTVMMLKSTILPLEEFCYASFQDRTTVVLTNESNATRSFFLIIEALCTTNLFLKVRQLKGVTRL
jgi:hypothetical protein